MTDIVRNVISGSTEEVIEVDLPKDDKQKTFLESVNFFCHSLECVNIELFYKQGTKAKIIQYFTKSGCVDEYNFPQSMVDTINMQDYVKLKLTVTASERMKIDYKITVYKKENNQLLQK